MLDGWVKLYRLNQCGDEAVANGEVMAQWRGPERELAQQSAGGTDAPSQGCMGAGVDEVQAAGEDGYRAAAAGERPAVGGGVDAASEPGDHRQPGGGQSDRSTGGRTSAAEF